MPFQKLVSVSLTFVTPPTINAVFMVNVLTCGTLTLVSVLMSLLPTVKTHWHPTLSEQEPSLSSELEKSIEEINYSKASTLIIVRQNQIRRFLLKLFPSVSAQYKMMEFFSTPLQTKILQYLRLAKNPCTLHHTFDLNMRPEWQYTVSIHFDFLQLENGIMKFSTRVGSNYPINMSIADLEITHRVWHNVKLSLHNQILQLFVDGEKKGEDLDAASSHDFLEPYLTTIMLGGVLHENLNPNRLFSSESR